MTTITSTEAGATGRYINLGSSAAQDNIGAQTVIAYCKPTSFAVTAYLFSKCDSTGAGRRLSITTTTGKVAYAANSSSQLAAPAIITTAALTLNTWQHVQMTWAGGLAASGINIYFDASTAQALDSATDGIGAIASDAAESVYLMNRVSLDREFVGDAGYIAQWNRVLSGAERTTVRTDGPLAVPSGLVLCWANNQDYSTNAVTPTARSTFVAGGAAPNTALDGAGAATATTLTGPASGTTGVASTNFTVGANGTITGTVTVTPGDAANGGTFTPTTVAISSGTPTATFTYTPASTGVKTISISDDGGLTDATPLSYTSNAAATSEASMALTLDAAVFAGLASVSPLTVLSITMADAAFSGSASVTAPGSLTLPALKNNTGTLLINETGATVHVYQTTGAHVVTKTGQTTNASGIMTITDAALVAATQYRVVVVLGSGAEGMDKVTAA